MTDEPMTMARAVAITGRNPHTFFKDGEHLSLVDLKEAWTKVANSGTAFIGPKAHVLRNLVNNGFIEAPKGKAT